MHPNNRNTLPNCTLEGKTTAVYELVGGKRHTHHTLQLHLSLMHVYSLSFLLVDPKCNHLYACKDSAFPVAVSGINTAFITMSWQLSWSLQHDGINLCVPIHRVH